MVLPYGPEAHLTRWGEIFHNQVAEIHPELSTVRVRRYQRLSAESEACYVVVVTLLLTPFAAAIMTRLGNSVSDVTSAAARKLVGRFLEARQDAMDSLLEPRRYQPRRVVELRVLVPDTGVTFVLPGHQEPEERSAAALAMLHVDVSPFGTEERMLRWIRGAWTVSIQSGHRPHEWKVAFWTPEAGAWLLPDGSKYPPVS